MLPDFLIIGAPKCGTTSLWSLLREHPDVYMHHKKELRFFYEGGNWHKGWDWYESFFEDATEGQTLGEASPEYLDVHIWPDVPVRIRKHLPDVRLILMVRHPVDRIDSAWKQFLSTGHHLEPTRGLDPMPEEFGEALFRYPRLAGSSCYWRNLCAFREHFPPEQMLVLFFEDFVEDPQASLSRSLEFIGVDPDFRVEDSERPRNPSGEKRMQTPLRVLARKLANVSVLGRMVPEVLREPLRRIVCRDVPAGAPWTRSTLAEFLEVVRPDARALLAEFRKPEHYWPLALEQNLDRLQGSR